ncbi:MAG: TolC family protein, partial [Campylobacterales bacterium]
MLELKVGKSITTLDNSKFRKSLAQKSLELDAIKAIKENKNALINLSETIDSYYYPNIRIEDSYTFFGYKDKPVYAGQAIPMLDTQNKLILTLGLRLFDFGTLSEQK